MGMSLILASEVTGRTDKHTSVKHGMVTEAQCHLITIQPITPTIPPFSLAKPLALLLNKSL
jgi:hypothetical protein